MTTSEKIEYRDYKAIRFRKEKFVGYVTLHRPDVLNAINGEMSEELVHVFRAMEEDAEVRCVILNGEGRAFCAGADLSEMGKMTGGATIEAKRALSSQRQEFLGTGFVWRLVEQFDKPVIAAIHNWAPAGGTELAVCCDMVVATKDAKFALREPAIGLFCAGAFTRLPQIVGKLRAKEFILTADWFTGEEMYRWGLVNRLVDTKEELLPKAQELADIMANNAPLSVIMAKRVINKSYSLSHDESLNHEGTLGNMIMSTDDAKEGPKAFFEKRKPNFKAG
jgi:enoyl-CoA hydratase/carnithine racemase